MINLDTNPAGILVVDDGASVSLRGWEFTVNEYNDPDNDERYSGIFLLLKKELLPTFHRQAYSDFIKKDEMGNYAKESVHVRSKVEEYGGSRNAAVINRQEFFEMLVANQYFIG